MTDHLVPLDKLYAHFDAFAVGRARGSGGWAAHEAVLDRLADNQRVAEANGWTSCALERSSGMGRLRAFGIPPSEFQRHEIPDWPFEPRQ